ncbi:MAG: deoxyribose-phosphate aldolase [Spirochaetaceae bacterium]|jgi:deoxyribose-phosphate aldolase|nr:deoxyribose-phosphate aldolase [Spirochaetaceae bacterium]
MTNAALLSHVDHTLLKPTASWNDIHALCLEAVQFKTASVCIPPSYVEPAYRTVQGAVRVCTVIGFPLGYNSAEIKCAEAAQALAQGADELDMVIDLGAVKNGDFGLVRREIEQIKRLAGERILKVIVETCYLSEAEKIQVCAIVGDAGADYIKTSTGFGSAGAVLSDIALFKKHLACGIKIKAAGGIKTREVMEAFLEAGCERIGSSSAVALLKG